MQPPPLLPVSLFNSAFSPRLHLSCPDVLLVTAFVASYLLYQPQKVSYLLNKLFHFFPRTEESDKSGLRRSNSDIRTKNVVLHNSDGTFCITSPVIIVAVVIVFPWDAVTCPHRHLVTWCPKGIKERTLSWTRRSRLSAGRMKHSWSGTRSEHVHADEDDYARRKLGAYMLADWLPPSTVWRLGGGGGQETGGRGRNGSAVPCRESRRPHHHNQQVQQCEFRWLGPVTRPLSLFHDTLFSTVWSRTVVWWWRSPSAAVHQLGKNHRRLGRSRGRRVLHQGSAGATWSSSWSPWLAKRSTHEWMND